MWEINNLKVTSDPQQIWHKSSKICHQMSSIYYYTTNVIISTSGVTSLGAKPVPPVVKITFRCSLSLHSISLFWKWKQHLILSCVYAFEICFTVLLNIFLCILIICSPTMARVVHCIKLQ